MLKAKNIRDAIVALVMAAIIAIALHTNAGALNIRREGDWQTYPTKHFLVHASARADIKQIGRTAEAIYEQMAPRYNYGSIYRLEKKIDLYVYSDRSAFLEGSPSVNAAGYAYPSGNVIAVLQGAGNSTITLIHEINHILFLKSLPRADKVPQWFVEGLAVYESRPGIKAADLDRYAAAKDDADIVGPSSPAGRNVKTRRDYAEGYIMVSFMAEKYGKEKLYDVVGRLQAGSDFDAALFHALGRGESELNAEWHIYAQRRATVAWVSELRYVGWYLLGVAALLISIYGFIKQRLRLRNMEDDELDSEDSLLND